MRILSVHFWRWKGLASLLDKALTTELYGYALRKGDPLIGSMNQALQKLRADGSHAALVTRWFGAAK